MKASFIKVVNEMTNKDVQWDGNFLGLYPKIINKSLADLVSIPDLQIDQSLLLALEDENRYVVSHVLLTMRNCKSYHFDTESWNGLQVQIHADNTVTFSGNDLIRLKEDWIKFLGAAK